MAEYFTGEIVVMAAGGTQPAFIKCDGRLLEVERHGDLYALIGNAYGGDGKTHFAVPNLVDRVPLHYGADFPIGSSGGEATVMLDASDFPYHHHALNAVTLTPANPAQLSAEPAGLSLSVSNPKELYASPASVPCAMAARAIGETGGTAAHDNCQPVLAVQYYICIQGVYPRFY